MAKKKILIVDDDHDLLIALRVRLAAQGYATVCAQDANSAVQEVIKEQPDLILLDLGLPEDNGFIVMEKLKNLGSLSSIPVIIVSARPAQVYKDPAIMGGARGYFQKPFDNDELLDEIRRTLGE
jgi:two-component system KDP operon response regulator KdpE